MTKEEERDALKALLACPGWKLLQARAEELAKAALFQLERCNEYPDLMRSQGQRTALRALMGWPEGYLKTLRAELKEKV